MNARPRPAREQVTMLTHKPMQADTLMEIVELDCWGHFKVAMFYRQEEIANMLEAL